MKLVLLILCLGIVLGLMARVWVRRRRALREDKPSLALVFLLSKPRGLTEEQVRFAFAEAWDLDLSPGSFRNPDWLRTEQADRVNQRFTISARDRLFEVEASASPYLPNPEEFAKSIENPALRQAVAAHRAWISVGLSGVPPSEEEKPGIYASLGKLLAAFSSKDSLVIYCPELEKCNACAPFTADVLKSGKPLRIFEPAFAPVIPVRGDDPRLIEATKEARQRWPEFVAAFRQNTDREKPFVIEARFVEGPHTEFMWVSVHKIEAHTIVGRLENSPEFLQRLKEGDKVSVPLDDLHDWMCEIDGETVGIFTLRVLQQTERR